MRAAPGVQNFLPEPRPSAAVPAGPSRELGRQLPRGDSRAGFPPPRTWEATIGRMGGDHGVGAGCPPAGPAGVKAPGRQKGGRAPPLLGCQLKIEPLPSGLYLPPERPFYYRL